MNYKKLIIIFIIILLIGIKDTYALSRSELTILTLDQITTRNKTEGFTSVQGGTTTDKYIMSLQINDNEDSNGKAAILVLNKNNYKLSKLVKNPIVEYELGHANDCTYNSKTNELLVLSGRKINIIDLNDDSFTLKDTKELNYYYNGLGYDEDNNQYVLARRIDGGACIEIRDSNFNIIIEFMMKTNLTKQSLTVYKGNIYYVCYEAGRVTKHEPIYDGVLKRKENLIYVYNLKGKKQRIYYIPRSYKDMVYGEIENISFNKGKMLIQFNHANKIGYFTANYKKEVESTVNIETDDVQESEYGVYSKGKKIMKAKSKSSIIPIDMRYTTEGNYKYTIKREELKNIIKNQNKKTIEENSEIEEKEILDEEITKEKEEKYKEIMKELEIEVYYDPAVNRLRVKSNAKDLIFTRDYLYNKEELRKVDETLIVNVPDTSSRCYLILLGTILMIIGILTTIISVKHIYKEMTT